MWWRKSLEFMAELCGHTIFTALVLAASLSFFKIKKKFTHSFLLLLFCRCEWERVCALDQVAQGVTDFRKTSHTSVLRTWQVKTWIHQQISKTFRLLSMCTFIHLGYWTHKVPKTTELQITLSLYQKKTRSEGLCSPGFLRKTWKTNHNIF